MPNWEIICFKDEIEELSRKKEQLTRTKDQQFEEEKEKVKKFSLIFHVISNCSSHIQPLHLQNPCSLGGNDSINSPIDTCGGEYWVLATSTFSS